MGTATDAPPQTFLHGVRTPWTAAPSAVVAWVESRLGGPVRGWSDRVGGMSVGIASVVTSDPGRSLFVKAVNGSENPIALELVTRESELAGRLPELPHTPQLVDTGRVTTTEGLWGVVVSTEARGAAVRHPWRAADLSRVLRAWDAVAAVLATTPWHESRRPPPFFTAWSAVAADPSDPWRSLVTSWLDREARLIELVGGTEHDPAVLSHLDLRADNIVLDPAGADRDVWFVDWAHATLAARWVDYALVLADVVGSGADVSSGGPIDVVQVWRSHPVCSHYDPELLICVVAGLATALHLLSRRPDNPLLPHRSIWGAAMADQMMPFLHTHGTDSGGSQR